jgi:hypothetical protein
VRQFWRFQAKSKEVKGLKYLSLAKVAGDNIVWTSYAVYTDFEGLIKHARCVMDSGSTPFLYDTTWDASLAGTLVDGPCTCWCCS